MKELKICVGAYEKLKKEREGTVAMGIAEI